MQFYKNAPLVAFTVLAFAGGYGLKLNADKSTAKLAKAQLVACEKANEIRLESNQRVRSHMVLREAAEDALKFQATARLASYKKTNQRADLVAARRAKVLLDRIETDVKYNETPVLSCKDIVPL